MRINPITNVRFNNEPVSEPKPQNFRGIWQRLGQNYLDADKYCAGIFYGFTDGKSLSVFKDKLGRVLIELEKNGMTVEEGNLAYKFLFEAQETNAGYKALKKLRSFILTKTYANQHNVMFLEKEDSALVTAKRERISLAIVNEKIREFELNNGMVPKAQPEPFIRRPEIKTAEDLLKFLTDSGVA